MVNLLQREVTSDKG